MQRSGIRGSLRPVMSPKRAPSLAIRGLRGSLSKSRGHHDLSEVFWAGLAYNTEVNHLGNFKYNRAVLDIRFRF